MEKINYPLINNSNTEDFKDQGIRQKLDLVSVNKYNIDNIANNTFLGNSQLFKEIICEAYDCSRKAVTTVVLEAGTKEITIYVCENCKSKFEYYK